MKRFPLFGPSAVAVLILGMTTGVIIMPKNFKFGACVVAGGFAWAIIMMMVEWTFSYGNDESPEEAPAESVVDPVDEAVTTQPIGLLLARLSPLYISAPEDELGTLANSICQRAERLLAYRKEDGVIGEILQAYRVFIEQSFSICKERLEREMLRYKKRQKKNSEPKLNWKLCKHRKS